MSGSRERRVEGVGVSPGIVIGELRVHARKRMLVRPHPLAKQQVEPELKRFEKAIARARASIQKLASRVKLRLGPDSANIFEAHLMMLEDPMLIERTRELIVENQVNADFALLTAMSEIQKAFGRVKDEFFRQRLDDLEDVGRRLIDHIQHGETKGRRALAKGPHILIAEDLSPSEAACLDTTQVLGLITEQGSQTSHTAILCRSVGVPAVVGAKGVLEIVKDGDPCILDGNTGAVIFDPTSRRMLTYSKKRRDFEDFRHDLESLREKLSITTDDFPFELSSNIELPVELGAVEKCGGSGIGLFRTEYLFLATDTMPSEKTQLREYLRAAKAVGDERLIIRTFDLGGDKQPGGMQFPVEANPFLGWRAIRVSLSRLRMFRTQLRAILRASVEGNVQLMFPMISGVVELRKALVILEEVRQELRDKDIPFNEKMKVGIMIEVPSAVIVAPELARMVDFFSIGTNDLTQYTLAVDRNNITVQELYQSLHPAILRSIAATVKAARDANIWVGLCGELAADPAATVLLLGLGLDELSLSPVMLPEIKFLVRSLSMKKCQEFTQKVLSMCDADEIQDACDGLLKERFGHLPLWRPKAPKRKKVH
jgi:phosphoenolpyruvate-protein phosphotransferase (PTS system enzyme I)